jgi:hypothetical protein
MLIHRRELLVSGAAGGAALLAGSGIARPVPLVLPDGKPR